MFGFGPLRTMFFASIPISMYVNIHLVKSHNEHLHHPSHQAPPQARVDYVAEEMAKKIKSKLGNSKEDLIENVCPTIHGSRVCKKILNNDVYYQKLVESIKKNETPKFNVSELYGSSTKHGH